jgi:hypothetical protein
MTDRQPAPFDYPYTRVRGAADVSADDAASLDRGDPKNGAGKPPRPVPSGFDAKEKAGAIDEPQVADALSLRLLHAHAERASSARTVLEDAAARAVRAPNRRNLGRMQTVANEIGRRRGGGKLIRELLTQDLVDRLIGEED